MKRNYVKELPNLIGKEVKVCGWVHLHRKLGKMSFIVLRERTGLCQIIIPKILLNKYLLPETVIEIEGIIKEEKQSKFNGIEIIANKITIVSNSEVVPIQINKEENIPFNLSYIHRPLTLRKEKERSIFKIQSEFIRLYREYLYNQEFTEIHSTKISKSGLEGGSELFNVKYFEENMSLTQSPQFYKQMMIGVYERVFEVGKVYRAEPHNTSRHLSEYIGLEIEMGFIESVEEVMEMEESCFKYIFEKLNIICKNELEVFEIFPLKFNKIPRITYKKCIEILKSEYGKEYEKEGLNSEMEILIGNYIKSKYNSEFVFITKYPLSERPFYAMPSEEGNNCSETFELLYKGLEITSGGQRIHNYNQLVESIKSKGLNPETFESYLMPFKYGMPKHGGLGIGTERVIKQMLNLNSVQEASLIPRTRTNNLH